MPPLLDSAAIASISRMQPEIKTKWFAVIGARKSGPYDNIINGRIFWDSHDRFHYLFQSDSAIFLTEDRL